MTVYLHRRTTGITFLTLIIIPTIYSLVDDFTLFLERVAKAV